MTDDEKKLARAAELDDAIKAADKKRADEGADLDKKLSHVLDAVTACTDAVTAVSKRIDAIEEEKKGKEEAKASAADIARKIDALGKLTASKDDDEGDDNFDNLPATTREQMIAEGIKNFSDREPGEAARLAADSARTRYDSAIKSESVHDRERRHQSLRVDAQAMADDVYNSLGMKCPPSMSGETPRNYRHRLLRGIQRHSPAYKNIDLGAISDPKLFAVAESTVYADARREGVRPTDIGPGRLRMITKRGPGGHTINEFHGSPSAWMNDLAGPVQLRGTGSFLVPNHRGD
jgi:hypothetical protein